MNFTKDLSLSVGISASVRRAMIPGCGPAPEKLQFTSPYGYRQPLESRPSIPAISRPRNRPCRVTPYGAAPAPEKVQFTLSHGCRQPSKSRLSIPAISRPTYPPGPCHPVGCGPRIGKGSIHAPAWMPPATEEPPVNPRNISPHVSARTVSHGMVRPPHRKRFNSRPHMDAASPWRVARQSPRNFDPTYPPGLCHTVGGGPRTGKSFN